MGQGKVDHTFTLYADQLAWLEAMAEAHDLDDADKALRVLLDYAIHEGNAAEIFDEVRCHHC